MYPFEIKSEEMHLIYISFCFYFFIDGVCIFVVLATFPWYKNIAINFNINFSTFRQIDIHS